MRSLKTLAWFALGGATLTWGVGLLLAKIYLCGQPGPWAFLLSVVLGAIATLAFLVAAVRARSWRFVLGAAAAGFFTFVLQVLSLVVTLPGCSGV